MNANTAKEHNIKSLNSQQHTVMTHDHFATQKPDAMILDYPVSRDFPGVPVQGPAFAVKGAPQGTMDKGNHNDHEFLMMLGNKVLQIKQAIYRSFGQMPDLLTFGEVDHTNGELALFNQYAGVSMPMSAVEDKACQNFSVYQDGGLPAHELGTGVGWRAVEVGGLVVVFVHVPNAKAKDASLTIQFYKGIQAKLNGRVIDIVMGDTNQSTGSFTPECLSAAIGVQDLHYVDAHPHKQISPIDGFGLTMVGTNSKLDRRYDVAVYNPLTVRMVKCDYFTQHVRQSGTRTSSAVTDHMGIVIQVESLKT